MMVNYDISWENKQEIKFDFLILNTGRLKQWCKSKCWKKIYHNQTERAELITIDKRFNKGERATVYMKKNESQRYDTVLNISN